MHLLISHASAVDEACAHTLHDLTLPNLAALLGRMAPTGAPLGGDELSLATPAEQALAVLRGEAGAAPTAAWLADDAGLDAALPWVLVSPLHLSVGADQVVALAPEALELDPAESRALFDSLGAELWQPGEGWHAHWLSPTQWLVAHASLAGVAAASLDRIVNRNVEAWMPAARPLRTLQNELQMLLHRHPLNEKREARGALVVNSAWLSGCGASAAAPLPPELSVDARLRDPLLANDWAAWADAWRALDGGPLARLRAALEAGTPVRLTLCGERSAQAFAPAEVGALKRLWQRLTPPRADAAALLEAL